MSFKMGASPNLPQDSNPVPSDGPVEPRERLILLNLGFGPSTAYSSSVPKNYTLPRLSCGGGGSRREVRRLGLEDDRLALRVVSRLALRDPICF